MRTPHFKFSVGAADVTSNFRSRLISAAIEKGEGDGEASHSATVSMDDGDGSVRFPKPGEPVSIEIGWVGVGVCRFDGEVDQAPWAEDRSSGKVLTISAKSVARTGKAKERTDRHWDKATLGKILQDAASEAGFSIDVDSDLQGRKIEYEARDNEDFLEFAGRLAREHGAAFTAEGTRASFRKRGRALSSVTVQRGVNYISASDMTPQVDRPRFKAKKGRWYDLKKAELVIERIATGEDVTPEDVLNEIAPDKDAATWRAEADKDQSEEDKGRGTIVIDGEPGAEPGGTAVLIGIRAGIDGTYSIQSVSHALNRGSGFTTTLSLGRPQGGAGIDVR